MLLFVYHKALLRPLLSKVLNGTQKYCKSIAFKSWKLDTLWRKTAWLKTNCCQSSALPSPSHIPTRSMHCFYKIPGEAMITVYRQQFKMLMIRLHQTLWCFWNTSSGLSADGVQAQITTGGLLGSFPANTSSRGLGAHTLAFLNSIQ